MTAPTLDPVPTRASPRFVCGLLGLFGLCVFWAASAPFIGESNGGIVLVFFTLLFAWPATAYFLIARWGGWSVLRFSLSLLAVPLSLAVLLLLWFAEIEVMGWAMHQYPPTRPMFHNELVDDDRTLLPYWRYSAELADRYGHCVWADYDDNLLVVVATGVPASRIDGFYVMSRYGGIRTGTKESRIRVGDDRDDRFVILPRTRNALVVILPDGAMGQFLLPTGEAERFHRTRGSLASNNLLREARGILSPPDRAKWDTFLSDYAEPHVP